MLKDEAVAPGPRQIREVPVEHGVPETAYRTHDRYGAVAKPDHLRQPTGFVDARYDQQIGARVNDYKRGLQRRLDGPSKRGADQKRTDDRTFCEERLVAIIKRVQKADDPGFDAVAMVAGAQALLKLVQAKF